MKGRDILKNMVTSAGSDEKTLAQAQPAHKPAGAIRAMNMSLNRLGDEAAAAKELRVALSAGDKVIELDAKQIDVSFIQDRIPVEKDEQFDALMASIAESGQQVPILVRPHPSKDGHYQVAYGHRRLRAALALGRPVKAVVRQLSDEELIAAQGQENGPRLDLSFIEKALFAKRLEQHGLDREKIGQALSVDKPEVSRLLQVADVIPAKTILAVGPAHKIGRPRWLALADLLKEGPAFARVAKVIEDADFQATETNDRFGKVWQAAQEPKAPKQKKSEKVRTRKGLVLATVDRTVRGSKITVTSEDFARFLDERMSDLVEQFEKKKSSETNN